MVPDSTFLDYIEKLCFNRPTNPLEMYSVFYTMCLPPATKLYVINSRDEPMEFDYAPSNWGNISEGCHGVKRRVKLKSKIEVDGVGGNRGGSGEECR